MNNHYNKNDMFDIENIFIVSLFLTFIIVSWN